MISMLAGMWRKCNLPALHLRQGAGKTVFKIPLSLSRKEYKFVISVQLRDQLEEKVRRRLEVDRGPGSEGVYPIVSQYYDSPERDCYWEKIRRLASRRKIRVRMYGSETAGIPPAAFMEVKHKLDGEGGKRRLQIPVDTARRFVAGEHGVLRDMLPGASRSTRIIINEVFDLVERCGHGPAMQIRYDRCAYTTADLNFRITFDSDLVCRSGTHALLPDDPAFSDEILARDMVMMEVKSIGSVPYWFREWAAAACLCRQSFSKYCTALERHDPTLRKIRCAHT